MKPALGEV